MSPPIVVTPRELTQAAESFKSSNSDAGQTVQQLVSVLKSCGQMAGTDHAGRKWSTAYDSAVGEAMDAATAFVIGLGQMHDLLQATASNHANANHLSVLGGAPGDLAFPPGSVPWMKVPTIPSAFGGHADEPFGWGKIKSYLQGEIWPNGSPDELYRAAAIWRATAAALPRVFSSARDDISGQQSPEVAQILEQVTNLEKASPLLVENFMTLASACDNYANAIETAHKDILEELSSFIGWSAAFEAGGLILLPFTLGSSELGAQGLVAARAAATGRKVAGLCRALGTAAEAAASPVISAAGMFGRVADDLMPLILTEVAFSNGVTSAGIQAAMAVGLRRPYLRQETVQTVEAAATKTPDGKYFVVDLEPDIRVPVGRSYDPEVLALPKSPDGRYYLDAANRVRYPVNPVRDIGHTPGNELWRLREQAESQKMTQQEFNDFANRDPLDKYQIEDAPGNRDHHRELPRESDR